MQIKRYGGIDVGSNAARLIIKDLHPRENGKFSLEKRVYIRLPLRIGLDVFSKGFIGDEKMFEFMKAMDIFKDILEYNQVSVFNTCATSALRNAENSEEVVEKVRMVTGIDINVIDGFEEANLLYLTNRELMQKNKYYISADLGGGSLQLAIFRYRELIWANAFKTGTLRYITKTVEQKEIVALEDKVIELSEKYPDAEFMGSGGNINKISKMIGRARVRYDDMKTIYEKLNSISYYDRMKKYALREDRADVIIPALELYLKILKLSGNKHILVPKTGLADGIIQSLFIQEYGLNKLHI